MTQVSYLKIIKMRLLNHKLYLTKEDLATTPVIFTMLSLTNNVIATTRLH